GGIAYARAAWYSLGPVSPSHEGSPLIVTDHRSRSRPPRRRSRTEHPAPKTFRKVAILRQSLQSVFRLKSNLQWELHQFDGLVPIRPLPGSVRCGSPDPAGGWTAGLPATVARARSWGGGGGQADGSNPAIGIDHLGQDRHDFADESRTEADRCP